MRPSKVVKEGNVEAVSKLKRLDYAGQMLQESFIYQQSGKVVKVSKKRPFGLVVQQIVSELPAAKQESHNRFYHVQERTDLVART